MDKIEEKHRKIAQGVMDTPVDKLHNFTQDPAKIYSGSDEELKELLIDYMTRTALVTNVSIVHKLSAIISIVTSELNRRESLKQHELIDKQIKMTLLEAEPSRYQRFQDVISKSKIVETYESFHKSFLFTDSLHSFLSSLRFSIFKQYSHSINSSKTFITSILFSNLDYAKTYALL